MNIKHKVIQDYQFTTNDKKIVILKIGTILENYTYSNKSTLENIKMDKDIIDKNTSFFKQIDWKEELNSFIKTNKIPQPAVLTKKLVPFIEEMFILNNIKSDNNIDFEKELKFKDKELTDTKNKLVVLETQINEKMLILNNIKSDKNIDFEKELKSKDKELTDTKNKLVVLETQINEKKNLFYDQELTEKENRLSIKESILNSFEKELLEKQKNISEFKDKLLIRIVELKNMGYLDGNINGKSYTLTNFIKGI